MSEHHEVECDECGKREPIYGGFALGGQHGIDWQRPTGWHRVDRRDLCSWNCRVKHENRVIAERVAEARHEQA